MSARAALAFDHDRLIRWTLKRRALEHDPGRHFDYSNFGYCLLGRVIEHATGMPYEESVRQLVLRPSGIESMRLGADKKENRWPNEVVYVGQNEDPYDPVMQVANILMPKAHLVPVGEDQLPHIEMTREVARKFNRLFGDVFPEPEGLVGRVPRLVGLDGNAKMSKSLENAIYLKDDEETVTKKVMSMYTDPTRLRATDPGHVEGNPVFMYHDAFNLDTAEVDDLKERYVKGTVGDVEVKQKLAAALNAMLDPIRDRRAEYEAKPDAVREALANGTEYARKVAGETMAEVRSALKLNYLE